MTGAGNIFVANSNGFIVGDGADLDDHWQRWPDRQRPKPVAYLTNATTNGAKSAVKLLVNGDVLDQPARRGRVCRR